MKKVNILFDDTTIFNFSFIWELMKRYFLISLLTPVMIVGISLYFYFNQNDLFISVKGFKNLAAETDSATTAIASLLGEKTSGLSPSEIVGMAKSSNFIQQLAKDVHEHPKFKFMNLNHIKSQEKKTPVGIRA